MIIELIKKRFHEIKFTLLEEQLKKKLMLIKSLKIIINLNIKLIIKLIIQL